MTNKHNDESNTILNGAAIPDFSEHKEELLREITIYLEGIENLKKEISNLENNLADSNREFKIPVIVLETMPLEDLEVLVDNLQQKMTKLTNFVNMQEEELTLQADCVRKIKAKLDRASETNKLTLKTELGDAQEAMQLLEKTLSGQRRNLKKRQEILNQHLKILNRRKGIFELKSFDTINLDAIRNPLPLSLPEQKQQLDFPQPTKAHLSKAKKQEKQQRQWPKWTIAVLVVGLLVILGSILYSLKLTSQLFWQPSPELVLKPLKPKAVAAVGYLEPKGEAIKLSAPATSEGARVEQLLVRPGDWVKAGEAIAILDSREALQAALAQALNQVNMAQAELARIKAGAKPGEVKAQDAEFQRIQAELAGQIASQTAIIKELEARLEGEQQSKIATITRIKAELRHAEGQCQRYQSLFENGAVSQQQVQQICLQQETNTEHLREAQAHLREAVNTLQAQITAAKANLERIAATLKQQVKAEGATLSALEEVRSVDVQVAQAELEAAEAAVQKAEAELKLAYIRAPRDGQILKIYTWPGETINDEGIVDMGQTEQMYVRAEVYETDISKVRIGQKATVKSNGIVEDLPGTVEEIGLQIGRRDIFDTDPVADADARVVEVKISLPPEASEKVAGLTNLQVNVIVDTSSL